MRKKSFWAPFGFLSTVPRFSDCFSEPTYVVPGFLWRFGDNFWICDLTQKLIQPKMRLSLNDTPRYFFENTFPFERLFEKTAISNEYFTFLFFPKVVQVWPILEYHGMFGSFLFSPPQPNTFCKICEKIITKRLEYKPETFNFKFTGWQLWIEIQTLFTLFFFVNWRSLNEKLNEHLPVLSNNNQLIRT